MHTVPSSVKIIWSWSFLKWIDNFNHQSAGLVLRIGEPVKRFFAVRFWWSKIQNLCRWHRDIYTLYCACQILCKCLAVIKWIFDQSTSKHPFSKSFSNTPFEPNAWCQHPKRELFRHIETWWSQLLLKQEIYFAYRGRLLMHSKCWTHSVVIL